MTARNLTGETVMRVMGFVALAMALGACDASELADKAMRRTAETVVEPVVDDYLPGDQAQVATRCIIENANSADLRALVHDVGVSAGTSTVANVLAIAGRPETQGCLLREGLPTLLGGL